jgi:hypothetical protein
MIANFFHLVLGLMGLLLLYAGLFLTETEEGRLQNRLEELWIRVDDLQSSAVTRQAAFLQQVSGLIADGLVKLFGRKLFSVRSVASCLCFSMASFYLSLALFTREMRPLTKPVLLTCSLILLGCGFSQRLRYLGFAVLALGGLLNVFRLSGSLATYQVSLGEFVFGAVIYVIAILSVVGFVALTRWSLRLASQLSSAPGLITIILANVALSASLLSPLIFVELLPYHTSVFGSRVGQSLISQFLTFFYSISVTNLFNAALPVVVVLLLLAALLHRLVWPVISRPVYAAHRHGVITQHKLLTALGALCLGLAWPHNILVKAIGKAVHLGG